MRGREAAVRIAVVALAVLSAVAVLGVALLGLTPPFAVRALADDAGLAERTGLPRETALATAEQVRVFVLRADAPPLPMSVAGRSGFDSRASQHLVDVRDALAGARLATMVSLAGAAALCVALVLGGRQAEARQGLAAGGSVLLGAAGLAALSASLEFDTFFSAFHGLFFQPGTWTFDPGDLLIELFPERFWAMEGAIWAASSLLGGVLLLVAGRWRRAR